MTQHIKLLGSRNDVLELLQVADIQVSLHHTKKVRRMPFLNQWQWEKRQLQAMIGGNTEMIKNGITGILIKPREPEELAEAIYQLYIDKSFRFKLGEAARREVSDNYGLRKSILKYEEVYDMVLGYE